MENAGRLEVEKSDSEKNIKSEEIVEIVIPNFFTSLHGDDLSTPRD